jgi:hypothetical protein
VIHARVRLLVALVVFSCAAVIVAASDDALARAKELYRAAAYDEALVVLDSLPKAAVPPVGEPAEYRLYCLVALDRQAEVRSAIEAMVNADPFYRLSSTEASPRIRLLFDEIRATLLPGVVRRAYADAKAAYDRNDPNAAEQFDRLLRLLDAVDASSLAALSDVRTIAIGFRDLSRARLTRAAPPPSPPAPHAVSSAINAAASPSASAGVHYAGEQNVVPPVAIVQALPAWTPPGATRRQWMWDGALELLVSETGDVVSARLQSPIYPTYDQQLLQAALSWKYKPALRNGVPVKFMKVVRVRLAN